LFAGCVLQEFFFCALQGQVGGIAGGKIFVKEFGQLVGGFVVDGPAIDDGGGDAQGGKFPVKAKDAFALVELSVARYTG
jgi:hypothetical protein